MFLFCLPDISSKNQRGTEKNEIGLILPHSFLATYPGVKLAIIAERAEMLASQSVCTCIFNHLFKIVCY